MANQFTMSYCVELHGVAEADAASNGSSARSFGNRDTTVPFAMDTLFINPPLGPVDHIPTIVKAK